MEITQVRVFPVGEEKLKGFASIIFDDCFVVSDIKIIQGPNGLFVSMPSKKRKNGTFRDIAHPLNSETRLRIEESIIAKYREAVAEGGGVLEHDLRPLGLYTERVNPGDDDGGGLSGPDDSEAWR